MASRISYQRKMTQESVPINRKVDMSMDESAASKLNGHRRTLGVCWILYGILRLVMGICLILFSGPATVMFGALLVRVPNPFALMSDFHFVYSALVVLSILCGVFGLLAGLLLLGNQPPARTLALVAAFFSVSEIPFGTTLGIYTLVILLPSCDFSPRIRS
jgi:uncharacterized membrane protein HdeD (DUF308 family)